MGGKRTQLRYTSKVIRLLLLISMAGLLVFPSTAESRSIGSGTTITLTHRPGAIICGGFCPELDLTLWNDGQALVNGRKRMHVTSEQAARFRTILLPFRPADDDPRADPSRVFPNDCWAKVQWPVGKRGIRPAACDDDRLFEAILQALRSINLDPFGRPAN